MDIHFTDAERHFVEDGGNLWYLHHIRDDGWEVMRWSLRHRLRVGEVTDSQAKAREHLYQFVRPSSHRTRTALHHSISRDSETQLRNFPVLRNSAISSDRSGADDAGAVPSAAATAQSWYPQRGGW